LVIVTKGPDTGCPRGMLIPQIEENIIHTLEIKLEAPGLLLNS